MSTLCCDIETVPDLDSLDQDQRDHLAEIQERKGKEPLSWVSDAGLNPQIGRVIVIGWHDIETGDTGAWYEGATGAATIHEADGSVLVPSTEADMLRALWERVRTATRLLTFNGHRFDLPFVHYRSMVHHVTRSRSISEKWYRRGFHVDIHQELSVFGAFPQYGLDFACRAFGVPTPKGGPDPVNGRNVADIYARGGILRIARYCVRDVRALGRLFLKVAPDIYGQQGR